MSQDNRARLKQLLESGETRLQPLTFPQRELWEVAPVPQTDISNHICAFIQVKGALSPKDCEAAISRVVERQGALRLSFLPGKTQPAQMIHAASKPMVSFHELPPSGKSPDALDELMQESFCEPFDLACGPLYRVRVIRCAADDQVMAFAIHHAIADGWSLGVLVQDLCAAYVRGKMGMHRRMPDVPLSYLDWGIAERDFWQPVELEKRAVFWKSHLGGAGELWSRSSRTETTSGPPIRWVSSVPAELGRAARRVTQYSGVTLFSTLLAAFQIALSRWTGGQNDIVVGTPVANRTRQAIRKTMGYCAGIVPLRNQIDRAQSFSDHLRIVHQRAVDCFANAMPFVELVHALGHPVFPGQNPVFKVRFALQNHPVPDVSVPGLSLQLKMRSTGTARFDMGCEITEKGDPLEVVWLFRRNLFSLAEIEELSRIFSSVLASVCRSPDVRARELTI